MVLGAFAVDLEIRVDERCKHACLSLLRFIRTRAGPPLLPTGTFPMAAIVGASLVTFKVTACAERRQASSKKTAKSKPVLASPRKPTTIASPVTLQTAALQASVVGANLLCTGAARADDGGGAVGLLALLVPVAGFLAFNAGKGGSESNDEFDDDDRAPPTRSQDSKNYAKNLTIAGGQNRKRRNPPKPKNL